MKVDMKWDGFKEFDNLLAQLPRNVEERVIQKAVNKVLKNVLPEFMRRAPKHKTGEQSKMSKEYGSILANLRVRPTRSQPGSRGARVTTGNAFWAYFFDKGTRHQPARHWYDRVFAALSEKLLSALGVEIDAGVEREVKKLEK